MHALDRFSGDMRVQPIVESTDEKNQSIKLKNHAYLVDRLLELSLPLDSKCPEGFTLGYYVTHLEEEIDHGRASKAGMEFVRKIGVASDKVLKQLGK